MRHSLNQRESFNVTIPLSPIYYFMLLRKCHTYMAPILLNPEECTQYMKNIENQEHEWALYITKITKLTFMHAKN